MIQVNFLKENGCNEIILLQCTSKYPCSIESLNLSVIPKMKSKYNLPIGFSDHSVDPIIAPLVSIGLGATVIEKHFTIDKNLPGPDHWFSAEPDQLHDWANSINNAYKSLGKTKILPTRNELKMKKIARRCPVALTEINKFDNLDENNIGLRRSGNGLEAKTILKIHGKKAKRKISKGKLIKLEDFDQ